MYYSDTKPPILFHASPNRNITLFEPRTESIRHPDEGPVVFATASEAECSKFLVPCSDAWSYLGTFTTAEDGITTRFRFVVYSDEEKFRHLDKGGSIYSLPSDTFSINPLYDNGTGEWTSSVSVAPIGKKDYTSGLEAMLSFGINVYFVDNELFREIKESSDNGFSIIQVLEPVGVKKSKN